MVIELLNFIRNFNFVSSDKKIDEIMLRFVDLVLFASLSEIFLYRNIFFIRYSRFLRFSPPFL